MLTYLFFRRRYILSTTVSVTPPSGPAVVTIHQTIPDRVWEYLLERRDPNVLKKLSEDQHTLLALAEIEGDIAGVGWLLRPETVTWYSKIPVHPDEALLFNAFVTEKFRRQGVYSQLHAQRRLIGLENANRVITVIDTWNDSSYSANESFGMEPLSVNYLVKLFGVNILSIERGGRSHTSVHIDLPNLSSIKRQFRPRH